ncbi:RrF2 family transcriptional regulator [Kumtagia ephedrae]|uniref:Transcriptional regulator n=1 Tax=Kumtagia ephedrae TaxID=2116701 RepID=A0A2P7S0P3_9HYPH|nr:Rrf2 family transcriptional regulator [Mesorhizobium ephedrae]PSJ56029.1 transcriptional regulator [Mesorhizobium ephedrae]
MKRNSRLSAALHALVHMAQEPDRPRTSEEVARWLDTNPVVVRRVFAGLREADILSTERGRGGGMVLARPAAAISLAEIGEALGESLLPVRSEPESPGCLVEAAVDELLEDCRRQAEDFLRGCLAKFTLADLAADFRHRFANEGARHHGS